MLIDLKEKFTKKMKQFFGQNKIHIKMTHQDELIDELYLQYNQQGRFKGADNPFRITRKFVLDVLANFSKVRPGLIEFFRDARSKRASTQYLSAPTLVARIQGERKGRMIEWLGRKHKPQHKITKKNGTALTPDRMAKTKVHMEKSHVSFSPLALLNDPKKPRQRAVSPKGSIYERDISGKDIALWRKKTPHKGTIISPDRIVVSNAPPSDIQDNIAKKLNSAFDAAAKKNTTEQFAFTVTKEDILERVGAKRPIGQKQVMGDVSAFEVMKAIGVILTQKQNGRNFHWAHRHGWALKGGQIKENFDPTTAGSNYDTLFKIEAPMKKIIMDQKINKAFVAGEVVFDKDSGLPFKITYKLTWGTMEFIEIVIDPMSHRVPTVHEHENANSFYSLTLS